MLITCGCDHNAHFSYNIEDLGQHSWKSVTKSQLAQLDRANLSNKCQELTEFLQQQPLHTGFIPLSPLQFQHIRRCDRCIIGQYWVDKPVLLYNYVGSLGFWLHKTQNYASK